MKKALKAASKIYIRHLILVFITIFMVIALFSVAQKHPYLFSAITTFIYAAAMYGTCWHIGHDDSRKIPGFFPDKTIPVKVAALTAVVPIILLIIRVAAPDIWYIDIPIVKGESDFFIAGCIIKGTPDMIYRIWYLPFASFVPCGNFALYIAEMFVLPVLIFTGYYVGLTRFSILEFISTKLVYENKNKQNKKAKK